MTIQLPENLALSIRAHVLNGHFATEDDMVAAAVQEYLQKRASDQPATSKQAQPGRKPIWEIADDLSKSIPAEEWAKLPADGAEQLDHYIYGSPKRPSS
jgi:Arc/MetJ-type ribon-helix-helix transcriptional regulator